MHTATITAITALALFGGLFIIRSADTKLKAELNTIKWYYRRYRHKAGGLHYKRPVSHKWNGDEAKRAWLSIVDMSLATTSHRKARRTHSWGSPAGIGALL